MSCPNNVFTPRKNRENYCMVGQFYAYRWSSTMTSRQECPEWLYWIKKACTVDSYSMRNLSPPDLFHVTPEQVTYYTLFVHTIEQDIYGWDMVDVIQHPTIKHSCSVGEVWTDPYSGTIRWLHHIVTYSV